MERNDLDWTDGFDDLDRFRTHE